MKVQPRFHSAKPKGRIAELVVASLVGSAGVYLNRMILLLKFALDEKYHQELLAYIPVEAITAARSVREGRAKLTSQMHWFQLLLSMHKKRRFYSICHLPTCS